MAARILKILEGIFYSFPIQLLILHIKSNFLLLLFWLILFGIVTGSLGYHYGLTYLLLDPEYLGTVNGWSFLLIGLTFGVFMMGWQVMSYIIHSDRFPFLATLERPLFVFCINNSLIPILFTIVYSYQIYICQIRKEFEIVEAAASFILMFILGGLITIFLLTAYFNFTNKNILSFGRKIRKRERPNKRKAIVMKKNMEWEQLKQEENLWRVDYYMNYRLRPRIVRRVSHYDESILTTVMRQHHYNVLVIQIVTIFILLSLGFLIEIPIFEIPGGASLFIGFTTLMTLAGSFNYWIRGWRTTVFLILLFILHMASQYSILNYKNKAYGLNYHTEKAEYSQERLKALSSDSLIEQDRQHTLKILENWKDKVSQIWDKEEKPPMVVLNVSGGGSRASIWSMAVMQRLDSLLQGRLMDHTFLMTGASGGMFASAYIRELYYQKQLGKEVSLHGEEHLENISKDLLNSFALSLMVNDMFYPLRNVEIGGYTYKRDRGYYLEKEFIENTGFVLSRPMSYYKEPEFNMTIPMMLFAPVILNDNRKLIIGSQPVSYLTRPLNSYGFAASGVDVEIDGVEHSRFFAEQNGDNLQITSAVRMSATYPYFFPTVHLPSEPELLIGDAGLRDNFGFELSYRFIQVFKDWIKQNVGKLIIVSIRGFEKVEKIQKAPDGILTRLYAPVVHLVTQLGYLQDFNSDAGAVMIDDILEGELEVLNFVCLPNKYKTSYTTTIHMTTREKLDILNALDLPINKESIEQILKIFGADAIQAAGMFK